MELRELVERLAAERDLDLRGYKFSSLERRFRHRMFLLKFDDYADYSAYIDQHPEEVNDLLNTVLINVTRFFRDPQMWEFLREHVIPTVAAGMKPGDSFRVWSAGCASGEEAYSLAILLANHFGERMGQYEIKVYGTDIDEQALATARRGEYSPDKLQHVPADLRDKYFTPGALYRVSHEVRRLAIFGRSNLASDAPISHVKLLLCRNVLIYFDSQLQKGILQRLHYALDPDGFLVLGKAESQLSQSSLFQVVDAKWRIFRRVDPGAPPRRVTFQEDALAQARSDHSTLKLYYDSLLETLEPGVFVVDGDQKIISSNEAVLRLFAIGGKLQGAKVADTELIQRCPDLLPRLQTLKDESVRLEATCPAADHPDGRLLSVTLKPVKDPKGNKVGAVVYAEDITPRRKLQSTIEELETTGEELQSTNEELETTNEELQSTNEELETTNEELQSTNEELETTNEELQALNEELGTTNEELEARTRELDSLNERYHETLERLPWPVLLLDDNEILQFWNAASVRMFGLAAKSVVGLSLDQLPLQQSFRNALGRRYRETLVAKRPRRVNGLDVDVNQFSGRLDVQFIPLAYGSSHQSVLIVLEPPGAEKAVIASASKGNSRGGKKSPAKKSRSAKKRR